MLAIPASFAQERFRQLQMAHPQGFLGRRANEFAVLGMKRRMLFVSIGSLSDFVPAIVLSTCMPVYENRSIENIMNMLYNFV